MYMDSHGSGSHALLGALLCVSVLSSAAWAQQDGDQVDADQPAAGSASGFALPDVDTSQWRCKFCPPTTGWSGSIEAGAGYVSDDSFRFGDYRGLEEQGAYPVAGGDVQYRGDDGDYLDLTARDLGLDARSLRAEGGRQGAYRLRLSYDGIPHFISGDARTVYSGAGTSTLTLPNGWTDASTTGGMSQLDSSLHDVTIKQKRERVGLGLDLWGGSHWRYSVDFRHDRKEGKRVQGGNFFVTSALLPVPVDYETDQVDASVGYVRDRWQVEAAYYGSFFDDGNQSVTWDNPFTPIAAGADRGRLALPPDNRFNQVMLSGAWRSRGTLAVVGRLAYGRMEQDEQFLPATINSSIAAPALPRGNLDGRVDTRTANVRVSGRPLRDLTAQGELYYDQRDNKTPRDAYIQVSSDATLGETRLNRPYSYEKSGGKGSVDYRVSSRMTLSGGAGSERYDRTLQEVDATRTRSVWAEVRGSPTDALGVRVRQAHERRDRLSSYEPLDLTSPENPRLRKFDLANRERDLTRVSFDYTSFEGLDVGVGIERSTDDYMDSAVGLSSSDDMSYTLDVSGSPAEAVTAYGYFSYRDIRSDINGQDNITDAQWTATQMDAFQTVGIGTVFEEFPWWFRKAGVDVTYSWGRSRIDMDKAATVSRFPNLETRVAALRLFGQRPLNKSTDLGLDYLIENLEEDSFYQDGVAPDTIPNVLTLGRGTPGYTVYVIQATLRYKF